MKCTGCGPFRPVVAINRRRELRLCARARLMQRALVKRAATSSSSPWAWQDPAGAGGGGRRGGGGGGGVGSSYYAYWCV